MTNMKQQLERQKSLYQALVTSTQSKENALHESLHQIRKSIIKQQSEKDSITQLISDFDIQLGQLEFNPEQRAAYLNYCSLKGDKLTAIELEIASLKLQETSIQKTIHKLKFKKELFESRISEAKTLKEKLIDDLVHKKLDEISSLKRSNLK